MKRARKARWMTIFLAILIGAGLVAAVAYADQDDDAMDAGGARLENLQQNDGGWDWPLDDGNPNDASPLNTIGPIATGLARAYWNEGGAAYEAALLNAGGLLLSKTNNFSPPDGYLATMLDSIFGGSTYRDHVQANFYGPLAAGTYNRNGAGTLYSTASYVQMIRDARAGLGNLAEWDIAMGLVGAATCGADTAAWIDGVKAELNEHNSSAWYDVLGLAGALYGLALVDEDFDPVTGDLSSASNLDDLGDILVGYQIDGGGFAWNANYVIPSDSNETVQETGYAILALNQLGRGTYLGVIQGAADWLVSFQLGTGGWKNWDSGGENNEVTGEAMWGIHAVYVEDVWVDESGNDHAFGYGYIPFETLAEAVSMIGGTNGTIHIGDGTFTLGPGTYVTRLFIEGDATVAGVGATTLLAPGSTSVSVTESGSTWDPIIFGYGGTMDSSGHVSGPETIDTQVSGFEIDGQNSAVTGSKRFAGILLRNVEGEVSGNTLHDLYDADGKGNGPQTFGIMIYGDSAVDILNNTISDYSRGGIVVNGDLGVAPDPVAVVQGNTVTGNGFEAETGWWAENGIQFGYGASGQIIDNTVTGHWSNSPWGASGILIVSTENVDILQNLVQDNELGIALAGYSIYGGNYTASNNILVQENSIIGNQSGISLQRDANNVTILANIISGNERGISATSFSSPYEPVGTEVHYNSISGNTYGFINWSVLADIDATLNWWGALEGPTADLDKDGTWDYVGSGDAIWGNVIFSPWLGIDPDGNPTLPGVQITGPMLIIVAPVGPEPAGGYLGTAIGAANDLPDSDSIEVRSGTYAEDAAITDPVTIESQEGCPSTTFIDGNLVLGSEGIQLGNLRHGFTIRGNLTVGAGINAAQVHVNWNNIEGQVTNTAGIGSLDATYNFWGADGPLDNIVGQVHCYPYLPVEVCAVIQYMDDYGLNPNQAIVMAKKVLKHVNPKDILAAFGLVNVCGMSMDDALAMVREYGRVKVQRALRLAHGDCAKFYTQLVGYGVGGGAGGGLLDKQIAGGGGAIEGVTLEASYTQGDTIHVAFTLTDPITGDVVTDAVATLSVVRVDPTELVFWGMIPYDSVSGQYQLDYATSGLTPGYYDLYIGTSDGQTKQLRVEIVAP